VRRPRKRTKVFNVVSSTRRTRAEKPAESRSRGPKTGAASPAEPVAAEEPKAKKRSTSGIGKQETAAQEKKKESDQNAATQEEEREPGAATPEKAKPEPDAVTPEKEKETEQGATEEKGESVKE